MSFVHAKYLNGPRRFSETLFPPAEGGGYRQHAVVKRAIEGSNIDALRQGDAASEAGGGLTDHVLAVVFFRLLLAVGGDGEVAVLGIDFEPKNLRELSKIQRNRGE